MEFDDMPSAMAEDFPDFAFHPCAWPRIEKGMDWHHFADVWIGGFEAWLRRGMRAVKFKSEPRGGVKPLVWLDDEHLDPFYELCARHGILVQAHLAQPSTWWPERYDPAVAGPKRLYLEQIERVLEKHPGLNYLGVHFGGCPEDLAYIGGLMERFPNYHVDTSATKWVVRELSARPAAARELFLRHPDRILFGSDLVVQEGVEEEYYTSRFHVQRSMWETGARGRSMIEDPDAPADGPFLNGLELPPAVLRQFYHDNAARLLRLPA
jgi:predicted TIM-barrel fold metal-dependent hydrolase